MQKRNKKLWPLFSVLLMLMVLASIFLFPFLTRYLSLLAILLSLGMSIFLTVQRHRQAQKSGKLSLAFMRRAIVFDITGLLLTMGLAMFLAEKAGAYAAQAAGTAWGVTAGILAAIALGLIVGVAIGLLVRWLWGKLTKPILEKAA